MVVPDSDVPRGIAVGILHLGICADAKEGRNGLGLSGSGIPVQGSVAVSFFALGSAPAATSAEIAWRPHHRIADGSMTGSGL